MDRRSGVKVESLDGVATNDFEVFCRCLHAIKDMWEFCRKCLLVLLFANVSLDVAYHFSVRGNACSWFRAINDDQVNLLAFVNSSCTSSCFRDLFGLEEFFPELYLDIFPYSLCFLNHFFLLRKVGIFRRFASVINLLCVTATCEQCDVISMLHVLGDFSNHCFCR